MLKIGPVLYVDSFTYAAGTGDPNYTFPAHIIYSQDLNNDGIDEVIFSGTETGPNTPEKFSNTQIAIFGWKGNRFQNLTDQWLPDGLNKVEGVGGVSFGDFNGDGLIDIFLSGTTDMEHLVSVYQLLNSGDSFSRIYLGKASNQHDSTSIDINNDGYMDVVATGYGDSPRLYLGSNTGLSPRETKHFMGGSGVALGDFLGNNTISMILVDHVAQNNQDAVLYKFKFLEDSNFELEYVSTLPGGRFDLPKYGGAAHPSGNSHDIRAINLDFNHDELDDVIVLSRPSFDGNQWPELSEIQFLKNLGGGQFSDVTELTLKNYVIQSNTSYAPRLADFNGDGLTDIFLSEGSFFTSYNSTTILMQQSDGTFVDTGRSIFSSVMVSDGGKAAIARGPDESYYLVIENVSWGGSASVKITKIEFPERSQSESLAGSASVNKIYGLGGDDQLIGKGGNDLLDGGIGIDTAIYQGSYAEYVLNKTNIGFNVSDRIINRDGMDSLANIERLKFTDTNVALDIGSSQNAGSVYMLYKAAFNRTPDAGGMGYWLAQKDAGSNIVTNIAQGFVASKEFTDKYGTNPTNALYVDKLYLNVLGRAGETGGVAYWNQELDAGRISKAAVLVQFATLPEGASLVANLIANGIPYQEWLG